MQPNSTVIVLELKNTLKPKSFLKTIKPIIEIPDDTWNKHIDKLHKCYNEDGSDSDQRCVKYANGDIYEPQKWNGQDMREGFGRYSWRDGDVYEGPFHKDKRHTIETGEPGIMFYADKGDYLSNFFTNKENKHYISDNPKNLRTIYVNGVWVENKAKGNGIWTDETDQEGKNDRRYTKLMVKPAMNNEEEGVWQYVEGGRKNDTEGLEWILEKGNTEKNQEWWKRPKVHGAKIIKYDENTLTDDSIRDILRYDWDCGNEYLLGEFINNVYNEHNKKITDKLSNEQQTKLIDQLTDLELKEVITPLKEVKDQLLDDEMELYDDKLEEIQKTFEDCKICLETQHKDEEKGSVTNCISPIQTDESGQYFLNLSTGKIPLTWAQVNEPSESGFSNLGAGYVGIGSHQPTKDAARRSWLKKLKSSPAIKQVIK